jgi:hypothetical protein
MWCGVLRCMCTDSPLVWNVNPGVPMVNGSLAPVNNGSAAPTVIQDNVFVSSATNAYYNHTTTGGGGATQGDGMVRWAGYTPAVFR